MVRGEQGLCELAGYGRGQGGRERREGGVYTWGASSADANFPVGPCPESETTRPLSARLQP
eukprot:2597212-Rhodomonas_salina.1